MDSTERTRSDVGEIVQPAFQSRDPLDQIIDLGGARLVGDGIHVRTSWCLTFRCCRYVNM